MADGEHPEFIAPDGIDDVFPQHQVLDVVPRDDNAVGPIEPPFAADVEEALDLLVDPTDRLDPAQLVY